ncbi:AAA family ATPase [Beduini massiliensis]|uniref:AAA family ATPase n=1 Tax=Beduini massiliensis TaxID=1585974 RepID=UPI0006942635|nr:AAA family ATPase [Beduini massiliensis]
MYCIIITGVPASGKTTLAHYLSQILHIPMVSKDEMKEILFDTVGFDNRKEKVKLGVGSTKLLYYFAGRMMQAKQDFILENNFEKSDEDDLKQLFEKSKYQCLTLKLTGDLFTIYERYVKREFHPSRHRGHIVNDHYPTNEKIFPCPSSFEDYQKGIQHRGMDDFNGVGKIVEIDVTHLESLDYQEIAVNIKAQLE